MNFFPDFAPNSREEWRMSLLQSILREQTAKLVENCRNFKFLKTIQYHSIFNRALRRDDPIDRMGRLAFGQLETAAGCADARWTAASSPSAQTHLLANELCQSHALFRSGLSCIPRSLSLLPVTACWSHLVGSRPRWWLIRVCESHGRLTAARSEQLAAELAEIYFLTRSA